MVSANRRDRSFFMMGTSFPYFPLEAGLKQLYSIFFRL